MSCDLSLWTLEALNLEGLSYNNLPSYSFSSNVQVVVQEIHKNKEKNGVSQYKNEKNNWLHNNNNDNNIIVS